MILKQIAVFLENRTGELAAITGLLAANGVDLRALNIAETSDYGIIRFISGDQRKAAAVLSEKDYVLSVSEVSAVVVPDRPGGLAGFLALMKEEEINVGYMYSVFSEKAGRAVMILRVEDPEKLERILRDRPEYRPDGII